MNVNDYLNYIIPRSGESPDPYNPQASEFGTYAFTPKGMESNATDLYVTNGSTLTEIFKIPKATGVATSFASGLSGLVFNLGIDATNLYFANSDGLWLVPLATGVPALLNATIYQFSKVTAMGGYVYCSYFDTVAKIKKVEIATGLIDSTIVTTHTSEFVDLKNDGTNLFGGESINIIKIALDGTTTILSSSFAIITGISVLGNYVYGAQHPDIVERVDKTTGIKSAVVSGLPLNSVQGITANGSDGYVANSGDNKIIKIENI